MKLGLFRLLGKRRLARRLLGAFFLIIVVGIVLALMGKMPKLKK